MTILEAGRYRRWVLIGDAVDQIATDGVDVELAASVLGAAAEHGVPMREAVYLRVEVSCPLHGEFLRGATGGLIGHQSEEELEAMRAAIAESTDRPFHSISDRSWIASVIDQFSELPKGALDPLPEGQVYLILLTSAGASIAVGDLRRIPEPSGKPS